MPCGEAGLGARPGPWRFGSQLTRTCCPPFSAKAPFNTCYILLATPSVRTAGAAPPHPSLRLPRIPTPPHPTLPGPRRVRSKLMRIHAAVAGRHARHGQLLPLEVYLEEGLPLVGLFLPSRSACFAVHVVLVAAAGSRRAHLALATSAVCAINEGVAAGCWIAPSVFRSGPGASVQPCHASSAYTGQMPPHFLSLHRAHPQVLHVRDYPFATLCELCEQSMHAFVSFGTVACSPPCLKASLLQRPAAYACLEQFHKGSCRRRLCGPACSAFAGNRFFKTGTAMFSAAGCPLPFCPAPGVLQ